MEDEKESKGDLGMGLLVMAASGRHWKEQLGVLTVGERPEVGQRANTVSGLSAGRRAACRNQISVASRGPAASGVRVPLLIISPAHVLPSVICNPGDSLFDPHYSFTSV